VRRRFPFCSVAVFAWSSILCGQVDVFTSNYDNYRTNANLGEFVLTKANVNPTQFGKLYAFAIDGEAYAQPLYVRGVNLPDGTARNVLYVATMHNSVYAFDADAASSTAPLWSVNFGTPVNPSDFDVPPDNTTTPPKPGTPFTDILNEIGILGTPVIDPATSTLYAVHYTYSGSGSSKQYVYYLHALDLATGAEKFNGPVLIQATVPGSGWGGLDIVVNHQLPFAAKDHLQRPGLLLLYGTVYVAFGSHGDEAPWHGWLMAYEASTLQQTSVLNTTPNNSAAGAIWQGGRGLAADSEANIYLCTGNGDWDGSQSWGQSVLRLTTEGGLSVADYFTPTEWNPLNSSDTDFGSSGPTLIPGTNQLYAIGKEGKLFLLDKTNLGKVAPSNSQVLQSFEAADPTLTLTQQEDAFLVFNTAFWANSGGQFLYLWPYQQPLRSYKMQNRLFETTASSTNATAQNESPKPGMAVSAYSSLSSTGILWATSTLTSGSKLPGPGTLHAFDAMDVSVELWNSDMTGSRDTLGDFTKFANPTVANGKVFQASSSGEIVVYGLLPDVPGIASVVDSASYAGGVVSPGELVTIFGNSIGPTEPASASVVGGKLPFTLGDVQVTFNGQPAPLLYGSAGQINAVAPFELAGQSTAQMAVTQVNGPSLTTTVLVAATNPSIFAASATGTGQGGILNADLSSNSASNPAPLGSVVSIFATGLGVTSPASVDGVLTSAVNLPLVAQPVTVKIGGQNAVVSYQGAAPGLVAGISQINVQIPPNATPGPAVPITIAVGGTQSQGSVTVAVK
jgi:uncharacterized protein (TIGR03437 family)